MNSTPRKLTTFERVFLSSLVAICILSTIVGIINFFRGVSTIPMLNPIMGKTYFAEPEQIGAVLYRRFWIEIGAHPVIVFGGKGATSLRIWKGFEEVGTREFKTRFLKIVESELNGLKSGATATSSNVHMRLVVASSPNKIKEIQKRLPQALLFFEMPLPVTTAELNRARMDCVTSQFACWEFAATDQKHFRFFSRHANKAGRTKWAAVIMQLESNPNIILVFVHEPSANVKKVVTPPLSHAGVGAS